MCGIIGYFGSRRKIGNFFALANWNIHRGNDGVGIITPSSETKSGILMWKLPYYIEELYNGELNKDRAVSFHKVGSIGMDVVDEDKYSKLNSKFKKYISIVKNKKVNSFIMHHRGASIGGIEQRNIHPMVINNDYFVHNGTSYSAYFIGEYMRIFENAKFNSDTDTEVISSLYLRLKNKFKDDKKILKYLHSLVGDWGVILHVNRKTHTFEIIKDDSRPLWLARLRRGYLLISEPTPQLENELIKLYYLSSGHITPKSKIKVKDYTKDFHEAYDLWAEDITNGNIKWDKCDVCGTTKRVREFNYSDKFVDSSFHHRCFTCTVMKSSRTSKWRVESKEKKEWKEIIFPELYLD